MKIEKDKLNKNKTTVADNAFASLMGDNKKGTVKISVNDIRENPNNHFSIPEEKVKALALSVYNQEQLHNIVVYEDDLGDGKHYTLISGATRFRAISYLYNNNTPEKEWHNGNIDAMIVEKPKNELDEKIIIVAANNQREMTDEDYYFIIKTYEEEYDSLKANNQKPDVDKRDYVGKKMGKSGRWVTIIKNKIEGKSEKTIRTANSGRQEYNKQFAKDIAKKYKFLTTVSAKSITFKCCDTEELNDLLAHFGIDMSYDYKEEE
ncbi:ParB N-terminal domain-containing protein [uncultured Clostridium sp.]|uniref:ParB N-terminal domain-containing protein n=1 Tax=uncultured Clostridium sp. TaxID=59620 RepID=UPI00272D2919|nr:ParB N-terminal domain-containing protein [uncultured Clostridium sp.]